MYKDWTEPSEVKQPKTRKKYYSQECQMEYNKKEVF